MSYTIYHDGLQEATWFQNLHAQLAGASLSGFPTSRTVGVTPQLKQVLQYDKPDIILTDNGLPILVVERTSEVPSGHNVGQRFGRLAAAARMQIPTVYFGPYKAMKHGGETAGPRYMNLRLFLALKEVNRIEDTYLTTINWPVDKDCELIRDTSQGARMRAFMDLFFTHYVCGNATQVTNLNGIFRASTFETEQEAERQAFAGSIRDASQYDTGPGTVDIDVAKPDLPSWGICNPDGLPHQLSVIYRIGMNNVRSDPYAGMAMLYAYLYCGGLGAPTKNLILHFTNVKQQTWVDLVSAGPSRKDIRMFKAAADAILFRDGLRLKSAL